MLLALYRQTALRASRKGGLLDIAAVIGLSILQPLTYFLAAADMRTFLPLTERYCGADSGVAVADGVSQQGVGAVAGRLRGGGVAGAPARV